jgi:hypothetical protein
MELKRKVIRELSNYAHSKMNELQPGEQGEGIIGAFGVLGKIAKTAGFGVARKHSAPKKTKRKRHLNRYCSKNSNQISRKQWNRYGTME